MKRVHFLGKTFLVRVAWVHFLKHDFRFMGLILIYILQMCCNMLNNRLCLHFVCYLFA